MRVTDWNYIITIYISSCYVFGETMGSRSDECYVYVNVSI